MDSYQSNFGDGREYKIASNESDSYIVNDKNIMTIVLQLKESGDLKCFYESPEADNKIDKQKNNSAICSAFGLFLDGQIVPILLVALMKYYNSENRERECLDIVSEITKMMYGGNMEEEDNPIVSPIDAFVFKGHN